MVYYLYHHKSPLWASSDLKAITQMLMKFIAEIESIYPFPCNDDPFIVMKARPTFKPSFDEWILYNAFWNDTMLITQKEFVDKFILKSTSLHKDPVMSTVLFALEAIGVYVNRNSDDYDKLMKVIEEPEKQGMHKLLTSKVLSWIFSDCTFLTAGGNYFSKITDSNYAEDFNLPDDIQKKCVATLCERINKYYCIIMGGDDIDKQKRISNAVPSSSIYQFFYRNWFGLGKPDIFPNSKCCNFVIIDRFLTTYNLSLKAPFNPDSTSWIKCAKNISKIIISAHISYMKITRKITKKFYKIYILLMILASYLAAYESESIFMIRNAPASYIPRSVHRLHKAVSTGFQNPDPPQGHTRQFLLIRQARPLCLLYLPLYRHNVAFCRIINLFCYLNLCNLAPLRVTFHSSELLVGTYAKVVYLFLFQL